MDYIINWSKYETVFNGDTVTMELLPLTNEGAAVLMDYFDGAKTKTELDAMTADEKARLSQAMMKKIKHVKPVLADHVRGIAGFTVNGAAPDVGFMADSPVFFPLVVELLGELGRRSRLKKEDEKN